MDKDAKPGQRTFDVKLQGKTVLKNFDPARDGGNVTIQEFQGIAVTRDLLIELVPAGDGPPPILNALEVIKEKEKS